jgi:hypothetical protein
MNIFIQKFLAGVAVFFLLIILAVAALRFTEGQTNPSVVVNMKMENAPQVMVEAYDTEPIRYLMFWRSGDEQPLWVLENKEPTIDPRETRLYPAIFWGETPNFMEQVFPKHGSRPRPVRVDDTLLVLVGFYYKEEDTLKKGEYIRAFEITSPTSLEIIRTWTHHNSRRSTFPRPADLSPEVQELLAIQPGNQDGD